MLTARAGQWYLHLFDAGQPDWNWRDARVRAMFEDVIRFWLDRGVAGLRVDVAHGIFKDPELAGGGGGGDGGGALRWLDAPDDALVFARDPGFVFAANLGGRPLPLPPHREVLLASGPVPAGGALPRDTAAWLAV